MISVGRKETLPRQSTASTGRRKPLVQPPADAPTESMTTVAASPKKKAPRRQPKEAAAARPKAIRGTGRRSGNRKAAAIVETQTETLAPVEVEMEVEASAIVEEATVVEGPIALSEETALPALASAADSAPIATPAPAPHPGKRSLVTAVFRLFSALSRWAGVRR